MAALFAYLSYRDASAAIAWLRAIGFAATARQPAADGAVAHAELRLGDAVVMLATADADYAVPPPCRPLDRQRDLPSRQDVSAIYAAAIDAGATPVFEPETTGWGTERAHVLDPEGREWSFGTYEPGRSW